jgi:hypothetical protein
VNFFLRGNFTLQSDMREDCMLWKFTSTGFLSVQRRWSDFDAADQGVALGEFSRRERRFGGVPAAPGHFEAPAIGGAR